MPTHGQDAINTSRRGALKFAGGHVAAQVPEEANSAAPGTHGPVKVGAERLD